MIVISGFGDGLKLFVKVKMNIFRGGWIYQVSLVSDVTEAVLEIDSRPANRSGWELLTFAPHG